MQKRGLSNIISTVLIVLLVIVIIGVIWITISKIITTSSQNVEKSQQEILLSQNRFSIVPDSIIVDSDKNLSFVLKRLTGEKTITGINIVLKDSAGNIRTIYKNISFEIGESKAIQISFNEMAGLIDIVSIEIYPTINNGEIVSSSPTGKLKKLNLNISNPGAIPPGPAISTINISSCGQSLTSNNYYTLDRNLEGNSGTNCLSINSLENLTIDCIGRAITCNPNGNNYISAVYSAGNRNLNIKNCVISNCSIALQIAGTNISLVNNIFDGNSGTTPLRQGVKISGTDIKILDNRFVRGNGYGLYFADSPSNNSLVKGNSFDNIFPSYAIMQDSLLISNLMIEGNYLFNSSSTFSNVYNLTIKNNILNVSFIANDAPMFSLWNSLNLLDISYNNCSGEEIRTNKSFTCFSLSNFNNVKFEGNNLGSKENPVNGSLLYSYSGGKNMRAVNNKGYVSLNGLLIDIRHVPFNSENIYIGNNFLSIAGARYFYHAIACGRESINESYSMNNCTIENNVVVGVETTPGNPLASGNTHGIFIGSTTNSTARNNTAIGIGMGIVIKDNVNVGIYNNKVYNSSRVGIYDKATWNGYYHNNLIDMQTGGDFAIEVSNEGATPDRSALNSTWRNNKIIIPNGMSTFSVAMFDMSNAIFINTTYTAPESFTSPSSNITRKWYYRALINCACAKDGFNVEIRDNSGILAANLTTGTDGYTPIYEITDYFSNGTKKYYSNYQITVQKAGFSQTRTYNATSQQNLLADTFNF